MDSPSHLFSFLIFGLLHVTYVVFHFELNICWIVPPNLLSYVPSHDIWLAEKVSTGVQSQYEKTSDLSGDCSVFQTAKGNIMAKTLASTIEVQSIEPDPFYHH